MGLASGTTSSPWPTGPAVRTLSQGYALGDALLNTLGFGYNQPIHFLGHSLGTMVNCHAADCMHRDVDPSKTGKRPWTFHPYNTQMTLFDEAGVAAGVAYTDNPFAAIGVDIDVLCPLPDTALAGITACPWAKVIPDQRRWIDNYVSEVGLLHPEAANVLLWRSYGIPVISDFFSIGLNIAPHAYRYLW